jgi:SAM-dependent methyltransferase
MENSTIIHKGLSEIFDLPLGYKIHGNIISTIDGSDLCQESLQQQQHYDKVHQDYTEALRLPHTQEYMNYMDQKFLDSFQVNATDSILEICCGEGEALKILDTFSCYIGIDISLKMLEAADQLHAGRSNIRFVHADALRLPVKDNSVDTVIMLGGIHHVPDRRKLFQECFRVLKPGGTFVFREPASDWFLWKGIRDIIYKLSPGLDYETERPLTRSETVPLLEEMGFSAIVYNNYTFLGFCLFMNADILKFNKVFKHIPGIRTLVKFVARFDEYITNLRAFKRVGLQVIGIAHKS